MTNKVKCIAATAAIIILMAIFSVAETNEVIFQGKESLPLEARWEKALDNSMLLENADYYWIAYSFNRLMNENSSMGNCHDGNGQTLNFLIFKTESKGIKKEGTDLKTYTKGILKQKLNSSDVLKVKKEIGVMIGVNSDGKIIKVNFANMDSSVCVSDKPIIWLGKTRSNESLKLAKNLYKSAGKTDARKNIISLVALHDQKDEIVPFLMERYENESSLEIRKTAVFWLGIQDDTRAIKYLKKVAYSDAPSKIRKEAVFAIYLGKKREATEYLIEIAKSDTDRKVRKQAIFWLGQKASSKAAAELGEIAENSQDTELAKSAVFAISQLGSDQAINKLLHLAKSSKNPVVRKNAIFWLGQSDNSKVVDYLADLALKDD